MKNQPTPSKQNNYLVRFVVSEALVFAIYSGMLYLLYEPVDETNVIQYFTHDLIPVLNITHVWIFLAAMKPLRKSM